MKRGLVLEKHMKTDILVVHPYKHHAFHLAAGCKKSGRETKAAFPLYEKGLGYFLKYIPGKIGKKAAGYVHDELHSKDVISSPYWQIRKLLSFLGDPMKFQLSYDTYVAKKLETHAWQAKTIVLLQDHMPKTARAAKVAGIHLWSDQINYSYEAAERIDAHWKMLGIPRVPRDESDNIEILGLADYITAPSTYARQKIEKLATQSKHFSIIPYGVDSRKFFKSDKKSSDSIVIFARTNSVAKGGNLFLSALSSIGRQFIDTLKKSSLRVIILGELDSEVSRLLTELSFDQRIVFSHGAVPSLEVPKLLRQADLFVMPSLSDSMSLACIEAMQSSLPLIITPFVGIDCFANGKMGIEIEASEESIKNALLLAAESFEQWSDWGANAAQAAKSLSWDAYESAIAKTAKTIDFNRLN
ncbi:MAG TPA: hypothetical protein DCY64_19985 [Hydrogenophaga sp.]|nr:hypothetical protein [Hydrogenophaga sp.]HBU18093.1 hypothetical protein [Hydrogenophaga sp.]